MPIPKNAKKSTGTPDLELPDVDEDVEKFEPENNEEATFEDEFTLDDGGDDGDFEIVVDDAEELDENVQLPDAEELVVDFESDESQETDEDGAGESDDFGFDLEDGDESAELAEDDEDVDDDSQLFSGVSKSSSSDDEDSGSDDEEDEETEPDEPKKSSALSGLKALPNGFVKGVSTTGRGVNNKFVFKIPKIGENYKSVDEKKSSLITGIASIVFAVAFVVIMILWITSWFLDDEHEIELPDNGSVVISDFDVDIDSNTATATLSNQGDIIANVIPSTEIASSTWNPLTWFSKNNHATCVGELEQVDIAEDVEITMECDEVDGILHSFTGDLDG